MILNGILFLIVWAIVARVLFGVVEFLIIAIFGTSLGFDATFVISACVAGLWPVWALLLAKIFSKKQPNNWT